MEPTVKTLSREDRFALLRFVCSFAWADLEVSAEERAFVGALLLHLEIPEEERSQVHAWLAHPPDPAEIDPLDVPPDHRRLFLQEARKVVEADGIVRPDELENFCLFRELLGLHRGADVLPAPGRGCPR
ncbi:MAG: TerB family tellurite resistance protein [Deltaproteobacteria bacterium]|nr:TerB family tellurite resistance protein [Deltaproteobacteria bacterium]